MAQTVRFKVYVDWDRDGFTEADLVKMVSVNFSTGTADPWGRVADVGTATITLNNNDRTYSPGNTSSPLYGRVYPGKPVQIRAVGTGIAKAVFTGRLERIDLGGIAWGVRTVQLTVLDAMNDFQGADQLQFPIMLDATADQALEVLTALVYGGATAEATITWSTGSDPSAGDTVTINGVTYTFVAAPSNPYDVRLSTGGSDTTTREHLAQAINAEYNGSNNWGSGTGANRAVVAVASSNGTTETVTIKSRWPGVHGNTITLSKAGTAITVSGSVLTGGDRGTAPAVDFDTGTANLSAVGDTWIMGETNGIDALIDLMNSERGRFFVQGDGTLTFLSADTVGKLFTSAGFDLQDQHNDIDANIDAGTIYNQVVVNFRSRRDLGTAIVARAPGTVEIPAGQNIEVWTYSDIRAEYEAAIAAGEPPPGGLTLALTDSYGNNIGAGDLIHPVPYTDFTVDDNADPPYTFDYTGQDVYRITMIRNGTNVILYFSNSAIGSLYVRDLVIRGTGVATFEEQQITLTDWDSVDLYGLKAPFTVDLPFISDVNTATVLAQAMLSDYAEPYLDVRSITILDPDSSIEDAYELTPGSVINLKDTQIGLDNKFLITGVDVDGPSQGKASLNFSLRRIDTVAYLVLDDPVYGLLDENKLAK